MDNYETCMASTLVENLAIKGLWWLDDFGALDGASIRLISEVRNDFASREC